MRIFLFSFLLIIANSGCGSTKKGNSEEPSAQPQTEQGVPASDEAVEIQQNNGTTIHVVGLGNNWVSYAETIDGYTIVRNEDKLYEYAVQTIDGDLKPGGMLAHDPGERFEKELEYLNKITKHLRYRSPKLDELLDRKNESQND